MTETFFIADAGLPASVENHCEDIFEMVNIRDGTIFLTSGKRSANGDDKEKANG